MDITLEQNINLFALMGMIMATYIKWVMPYSHAWIDRLPDNPKNVWLRVLNSGHERIEPYALMLSLSACKLTAAYAYFWVSVLVSFSFIGQFEVAMEIVYWTNYIGTAASIIIAIACVRQFLFLRQIKKMAKTVSH